MDIFSYEKVGFMLGSMASKIASLTGKSYDEIITEYSNKADNYYAKQKVQKERKEQ